MKNIKFKIFFMLMDAMIAAAALMTVGLQVFTLMAVGAASVFGAIWLARALLGWF